jgi:hypothetical protein
VALKRHSESTEHGASADCRDLSNLPSTQLSSSDVRSLINFFLLLDKWDTMQSTHKPNETRPCSEATAA